MAEGKTSEMIVADLEKSKDAVYHKCRRLGLAVEEEGAKGRRTSSIRLPEELPSIEEALKILAGALQAASQAGLDKVEVQRLQAFATLARTYEQLVSRYVDYHGIEIMLIEMGEKCEALAGQMQQQSRRSGNDGNKSMDAHCGNDWNRPAKPSMPAMQVREALQGWSMTARARLQSSQKRSRSHSARRTRVRIRNRRIH